jgi:hypothetical protein
MSLSTDEEMFNIGSCSLGSSAIGMLIRGLTSRGSRVGGNVSNVQ